MINGTQQSATDLLAWWFYISVNFNLPPSLCSRCVLLHHTILSSCLFFWYYLPSYWFYCNEWNSKLWCIILDFMLYLLYGQKNKTQKTKQKHYRCKSRGFFSPAVFFYAVAKGCIFQFFLSNFNSDAKLGPLSALRTQSKFRLLFLRFYQRFSKMELHSPFFCLNCTTVPLYTTF